MNFHSLYGCVIIFCKTWNSHRKVIIKSVYKDWRRDLSFNELKISRKYLSIKKKKPQNDSFRSVKLEIFAVPGRGLVLYVWMLSLMCYWLFKWCTNDLMMDDLINLIVLKREIIFYWFLLICLFSNFYGHV